MDRSDLSHLDDHNLERRLRTSSTNMTKLYRLIRRLNMISLAHTQLVTTQGIHCVSIARLIDMLYSDIARQTFVRLRVMGIVRRLRAKQTSRTHRLHHRLHVHRVITSVINNSIRQLRIRIGTTFLNSLNTFRRRVMRQTRLCHIKRINMVISRGTTIARYVQIGNGTLNTSLTYHYSQLLRGFRVFFLINQISRQVVHVTIRAKGTSAHLLYHYLSDVRVLINPTPRLCVFGTVILYHLGTIGR